MRSLASALAYTVIYGPCVSIFVRVNTMHTVVVVKLGLAMLMQTRRRLIETLTVLGCPRTLP